MFGYERTTEETICEAVHLSTWQRMEKSGLSSFKENTEKWPQVVLSTIHRCDQTSHQGIHFVLELEKERTNTSVLGAATQPSWLQASLGPFKYSKNISFPPKCFYWAPGKRVKTGQLQNAFPITRTPFPVLVQSPACTTTLSRRGPRAEADTKWKWMPAAEPRFSPWQKGVCPSLLP